MTRYGKVAVFTCPGEPIKIIEEEIRQPAPDEFLVRVSIAGICGSDVHRWKGDLPVSSSGICFGHEAVGVIESIGREVQTDRVGTLLNKGDTLYWMPLAPCGTCSECGASNPLRCKNVNWPPPVGTLNGACFKQYATLNKECVYIRVSTDLPIEHVILFGCGMPTALRGFKQLGAISPDADIVIQGSGPVGLACTLLARISGARSVIVIGDPDLHLEAATSLGATHTISVSKTTPEARLELIRHLTAGRGPNIVVEAAGAVAAFPEGFDLLRMEGKYLILGLYSGTAATTIDPVRINNFNLQIIGSLGLDINSYKETVDIASKYGTRMRFANFITHRFSLENLEEALSLVDQGISIKAVVMPN